MPRKTKLKLDSKIKVAAVSYLNTLPLLYGINRSSVVNEIDLRVDYPSKIAQWLIDGEVDVALVPVAVIPSLNESHIVGDYGIGADGSVASVCLFSDVPVEQIKTVILDYQSRTSNELVRVLLREHWKLSPDIIYSQKEYRQDIKGNTAAVVIGDRAFEQKKHSVYCYDLAEAWKVMTGLPFIFAAWVSNKKLPEAFVQSFNEANAYGVQHIAEVIATIDNPQNIDLHQYYSKHIQYFLDAEKKKALKKFLNMSLGFNAETLF